MSAQRLKFLTMGGTEQAIVTHLDKAFRQNVLQETVHELFGGQGAELGLARLRIAIVERDLVVLDLDDAAVAEGDAKDVGGEIFERGATVTDGLAVNHPVLPPHFRREVGQAIRLAQGITELGAKELGERLDWQQEILAGGQPCLSVVG